MAFQCINATEALIAMIVDDGSKSRKHRENIFTEDFGVMGCYTGPHESLQSMTCCDYVGAFITAGDTDPVNEKMDYFLRESVDFDKANMPMPSQDEIRSWK